ncbi:hypothetical protein FRC06_005314 [Ceratobasidium sp. 370]|nr:hypothetical protein FRC06_005314 [Ceratobasidium sp. 370]
MISILPLLHKGRVLSFAISRGLAKNGAPPTQYPIQTQNDVTVRPGDEHLQKDIDALRAQLAQAELERQKLRATLEESKENSFVKAGEAENLRRTMRKQAEQHAEEVARLRQEMIDAENAKLEAERRMKLEMDQLRTAMAFKDDGPGAFAALSKKESAERAHAATACSRKEKSFSNLTNSFARSTSPVKHLRNRPMKFSESVLNGKDAFAPLETSTQLPPKDKGKGKARLEDSWLDENTSTPIQRLTFGTQDFWDQPRPATQAPFAIEPDIFGSNAPPQTPAKVLEVAPHVDIVEQVDYADELRMVLLTHIVLFGPLEGQKTFSMQYLLTVPVALNLQKRFSDACTGLFEAFSVSSLADGGLPVWDQCASKASLALAQLAQVLGETERIDSLCVLFNLLIAVCTTVPAIAGYLLKAGTQEGESLLASTVCSMILKCTKDKLDQSMLWYLGESTLALCETLGWQATDGEIIRQVRPLSALARTAGVFPMLLDPSYPPPWIVRATHALSVLASRGFDRPVLVRGLLTSPETDPPTTSDSAKVPLVELLCRHLSAYRKHDTKDHHRELYDNVLTTLSQLAIADTQSLTTLVESLTLIPSLVSFIYHVTSAIWSELELLESSTGSHDSCLVNALWLAVQLLHYLSFSSDPEPNIRERLCYAPRGSFNGLVHMFIVAFGRLSSGDPPEYLDETRSAMIREIRGMSEVLLGIVVEGPEVEGIYDVFHDSEDDERGGSSEGRVDASVADEEEALQMSIDGF